VYQVIGTDGAPGEPVSLQDLQQMAAVGTVNKSTHIVDMVNGTTLAAGDMFPGDEVFAAESAAAPAAAAVVEPEPAPAPAPVVEAPAAPLPAAAPAPPPPTPAPQSTSAQITAAYNTAMTEKKSKVVAGLLAIFLGSFGVHQFYIGNKKLGIILLCITVGSIGLTIVTFGLLGLILMPLVSLLGLACFVQGVLYLVASDADFEQKYVVEQRLF
jgi:TM2 domain-containing membrane protein YozV